MNLQMSRTFTRQRLTHLRVSVILSIGIVLENQPIEWREQHTDCLPGYDGRTVSWDGFSMVRNWSRLVADVTFVGPRSIDNHQFGNINSASRSQFCDLFEGPPSKVIIVAVASFKSIGIQPEGNRHHSTGTSSVHIRSSLASVTRFQIDSKIWSLR